MLRLFLFIYMNFYLVSGRIGSVNNAFVRCVAISNSIGIGIITHTPRLKTMSKSA